MAMGIIEKIQENMSVIYVLLSITPRATSRL
jgi:hypothetical protein